MTENLLYPLIIDISFDKAYVIYLIFEDIDDRKIAGPLLLDLFADNGIKVIKSTVHEWTLNIDGVIKYLRLIMPCKRVDLSYIKAGSYQKVIYV